MSPATSILLENCRTIFSRPPLITDPIIRGIKGRVSITVVVRCWLEQKLLLDQKVHVHCVRQRFACPMCMHGIHGPHNFLGHCIGLHRSVGVPRLILEHFRPV